MDARTENRDTLKADYYLCLARALMTPHGKDIYYAMRDDLPVDLAELALECGYDLTSEIDAYRDSIHSIENAEALLTIYSQLFLQPPQEVPINTGVYLDGGLNGGSVAEMENWYRAAGVERSGEFFDLSDHVALQLEYISYLFTRTLNHSEDDHTSEEHYARTPGRFLNRFVLRWIDAWCDDLESATEELSLLTNPYLPLARMLRIAAQIDAEAIPVLNPAVARREKALTLARRKRAERGVTEADMVEIRKLLAAKGLATDHLAPSEQREYDPWRDWKPMTPPRPR